MEWEKKYDIYGKLIFECEYLNGKINGKEYDYNGKLTFEGEYENGQINGKGKEYYDNGKLLFEGEYWIAIEMEKEKNMIIMVN